MSNVWLLPFLRQFWTFNSEKMEKFWALGTSSPDLSRQRFLTGNGPLTLIKALPRFLEAKTIFNGKFLRRNVFFNSHFHISEIFSNLSKMTGTIITPSYEIWETVFNILWYKLFVMDKVDNFEWYNCHALTCEWILPVLTMFKLFYLTTVLISYIFCSNKLVFNMYFVLCLRCVLVLLHSEGACD